MVIGFPPSGGTDAVARVLGPKLAESFGQPMVIDNRPGADTIVATEYKARATPDGYTLLLTTGAIAINVSLYDKVAHDALRDFAPISLIATSPHVLVVGPGLQAKTVKELLDTARARPGQLNYAGAGGPMRLASELFILRTKTSIVHVPYKGSGPAMTAIMSGEVQLGFANVPAAMPHAKAGRVRILGVAASARSVLIPDVPTMKGQGVDMESTVWYGLLAPAQKPKAIIAMIADASEKASRADDTKQRLLNMGAEPVGSSPEAFARHLRVEIKQWAEVVRLTGVKPD